MTVRFIAKKGFYTAVVPSAGSLLDPSPITINQQML